MVEVTWTPGIDTYILYALGIALTLCAFGYGFMRGWKKGWKC